MFKYLLLVAFLFFSSPCFSQDALAELYSHLKHNEPDSIRVKSLYNIAKYLYEHHTSPADLDSCIYYMQKTMVLARAQHQEARVPILSYSIGAVYLLKGDTINGEKYCAAAAAYYHSKHDTYHESRIWRSFGDAVWRTKVNKAPAAAQLLVNLSEKYYLLARRALSNEKDINIVIKALAENAQSYAFIGARNRSKKMCIDLIQKYDETSLINVDFVYPYLSQLYRNEGDSDSSVYYMIRCIKRIDRLKDTVNTQVAYGELALVYQELGQTESSIVWYKKTLQLREKIPNIPQEYLYRTAGFIVQGLVKQGKAAEGLKFISDLEKRKPPIDDNGRAMVTQVEAYCYNGLKQYDKAERLFHKMMKLLANNKSYLINFAKYDIGEFYVRQKKYDSAAVYLEVFKTVSYNVSKTRDVEYLFFKIDSAQGRTLSALQHFQRFKLLNDSIFNTAKNGQIQELQIKYATEQKENDIRSLKKEQQSQYQQVKQANNVRNLMFLGIGLLLVVIGLLYKSYRINQKKTKEIDLKNASLHKLVIEKDSLLEEKQWLMKEIHHRVKNNLQIVMGLLQRQSSFVNNEEALNAIRDSEHRMHSIALIHQKLYQSESFAMVSMSDYIDEMTGYLRESFDLGTRISFEREVDDIDLELNTAVPLGLILNEAITNAIKYAFATHEKGCIRVSLNQIGANSYMLQIADNGRGLPAEFDIKKTNSMGFNLMRGLSKQVGGSLEVTGDSGVCVVINFATTQKDREA